MQFFSTTSLYLALIGLSSVLAEPSKNIHVARQISEDSSSGSASKAVSPLTPLTTKEGSPLLIQWDKASSSKWKSMEIKFMTGSNQQMTELYTVATGVDGTASGAGALQWTAPAVEPNSAIYFFQFTHDGKEPTWTTRFAIADAEGKVTPPPEANQPEGPPIPWGEGKLENAVANNGSSNSSNSTLSTSTGSATQSLSRTTATPTPNPTSFSTSLVRTSSTSSASSTTNLNSGNQVSSSSSAYGFGSAVAMLWGVVAATAAGAVLL